MSNYPRDDSFYILLATDIHLGYAEKDEIRGKFFVVKLACDYGKVLCFRRGFV